MRKTISTRTIATLSLFLALSIVSGFFLKIPYPVGGYFNFGDSFSLLAICLLGPIGIAIPVLSGLVLDLLSGSIIFLPFTFFAKLLLGTFFYLAIKQKKPIFIGLILLVGVLLHAGIYLIYYLYLEGLAGFISFGFDLLQGSISYIISFVFLKVLNFHELKTHHINK